MTVTAQMTPPTSRPWSRGRDLALSDARMRPPHVPEQPVPVLTVDAVRALVGSAEKGKAFEDLRGAAILRVFIDTGARLEEVAGIRFAPGDEERNDLELDVGVVRVLGKGRRERVLPIGPKTIKADRPLRVRSESASPGGRGFVVARTEGTAHRVGYSPDGQTQG